MKLQFSFRNKHNERPGPGIYNGIRNSVRISRGFTYCSWENLVKVYVTFISGLKMSNGFRATRWSNLLCCRNRTSPAIFFLYTFALLQNLITNYVGYTKSSIEIFRKKKIKKNWVNFNEQPLWGILCGIYSHIKTFYSIILSRHGHQSPLTSLLSINNSY